MRRFAGMADAFGGSLRQVLTLNAWHLNHLLLSRLPVPAHPREHHPSVANT